MDIATSVQEPDTRTRIVETAERFFRQMGYQKTTVADIARELKMSPANVYRFFESKKAINEAVADRLMRGVEAAIAQIALSDAPAIERLVRMAHTMHAMNSGLYTEDRRMHEMVECALCESWHVVHGHIERKSVIFEEVVADGVTSGEFGITDAKAGARCFQMALMRFFHPALIVQCGQEPDQPSLDQMIAFALAGLKPRAG